MKRFLLHLLMLIIAVPVISGIYESMGVGGFNFDWIEKIYNGFAGLVSHPDFLEKMSTYIVPIGGFFAAIWVTWAFRDPKSKGKWTIIFAVAAVTFFTWLGWGILKHGGSAEAFISALFASPAPPAAAPQGGGKSTSIAAVAQPAIDIDRCNVGVVTITLDGKTLRNVAGCDVTYKPLPLDPTRESAVDAVYGGKVERVTSSSPSCNTYSAQNTPLRCQGAKLDEIRPASGEPAIVKLVVCPYKRYIPGTWQCRT